MEGGRELEAWEGSFWRSNQPAKYKESSWAVWNSRSTIHDHVSGKVQPGATSGPKPYLSETEEDELTSFIIKSAEIGYPRTKSDVSL